MKKGVLYNLIARGFFIVGAYVLHVTLARLVGAEHYGLFGVVLSILMVCYIFLNNGVRQAVSKLAATHPESSAFILKKGLKYQIVLSSSLAIVLIGLNPFLVRFFNDSDLKVPLYLAAIVIVAQGPFFVFAGILNGLHRFLNESLMLTVYSILRPITVLAAVYLGYRIAGAVAGLLIASTITIAVGALLCYRELEHQPLDLAGEKIFSIAWPTVVIFGFVIVIMNVDLMAVKHYISEDAEITGFYTSASVLARPFYWVLFAVGSVGLPVLARQFNKGDIQFVRTTVQRLTTYIFCLVGPAAVIYRSTLGSSLIEVMYKPEFAPAAQPFSVLVIGVFFLGLASVFAHCLIAVDRQAWMSIVAVVAGTLCICLNVLLVPKYQMMGAATATTISSLVMALLSWIVVSIAVGNFVNPYSLLKWIAVLALTWLIAEQIEGNLSHILTYSFVLYLAACAAFVLLKEFSLKGLFSGIIDK